MLELGAYRIGWHVRDVRHDAVGGHRNRSTNRPGPATESIAGERIGEQPAGGIQRAHHEEVMERHGAKSDSEAARKVDSSERISTCCFLRAITLIITGKQIRLSDRKSTRLNSSHV